VVTPLEAKPQIGPNAKPGGRSGGKPHSLAGATVLQLVPALRDDAIGQAAVEIALNLVRAGARAIVAGGDGPLVGELRGFGGEWLAMAADSFNPLRIQRNTRQIQRLIAGERIDIVHAHCAAAAWSAFGATDRMPVFLVTSFDEQLARDAWPGTLFRSSLARGDRVIAPSSYISRAMIERYKIPPERIAVIPRAVDTARFSPAAVNVQRVAALRRAWGVLPDMRVVLVPGRLAPWNGQLSMIDAARLLIGGGERNIAFIFAGEDRGHLRYRNELRRRARAHGIDTLIRLVGHQADMPTALAAADVVVIPSLVPPRSGRTAAETQAMARPLVTTAVGALPENLLCPPRMKDELRTGWLVRAGHPGDLASATAAALALNPTAYEALGARARQFADFMFSPQSVAEAIHGIYTSLLARDA
jgi:glycosyltransferase involved in cell wall biosynthesis